MKASIIVNGDLKNIDLIKKECSDSDFVLCADGGAKYAYSAGVIPDYLIGDFDSINSSIFDYYKAKKVKIETYPSEKDYTDTELCVNKAIDLGCTKICIIGGIGDRIDHSLGNIGLLNYIDEKGILGYLSCDKCSIFLCSSGMEFIKDDFSLLSIIPFGGDAIGVTLNGLKYPLNNADIKLGDPIGISNVIISNKFKVSLKKGKILLILSK